MKEFLQPHPNGNYAFIKAESSFHPSWIEIPDGADCLLEFDDGLEFYRNNKTEYFSDDFKAWKDIGAYKIGSAVRVVWQRSETEYLMQGKNAEHLMESVGKLNQPNQKTIDAMHEAEGILNDKQLKGVEATLAQRQSEYGSFEDVAFVTENIMATLGKVRPNGLHDLPHTHRMALYMIASKMARIVNGDFNKLDSWHDIGGYAKLIENLIEGK